MRKNYVYLLFALFFVFSACKEENIEDSLAQEVVVQEPTLFTFIYKGKEYEELRSNPDDPLQNKVIEEVLLTDNYSIYIEPERKNTVRIFDTNKEAEAYISLMSINSKPDCDGVGLNNAVLYLGDSKIPSYIKYMPRGEHSSTSTWRKFYISTDGEDLTIKRPDSYYIPDLGANPYNYNDRTTSMMFVHGRYYGAGCNNAAVIVYADPYYRGQSLVYTFPPDGRTYKEPDLGKLYFYDFFGVKYGPGWNNKISSLQFYFY